MRLVLSIVITGSLALISCGEVQTPSSQSKIVNPEIQSDYEQEQNLLNALAEPLQKILSENEKSKAIYKKVVGGGYRYDWLEFERSAPIPVSISSTSSLKKTTLIVYFSKMGPAEDRDENHNDQGTFRGSPVPVQANYLAPPREEWEQNDFRSFQPDSEVQYIQPIKIEFDREIKSVKDLNEAQIKEIEEQREVQGVPV